MNSDFSDNLPSGKRVYFLSDLHLGAGYFRDPKGAERRVVRFLDAVKDDAAAIYLVGDVLDYWYEYRYVVPRGFTRFFGKLAELSDAGVQITWLIGNHDIWIFDYLPTELGITVVDGAVETTICGKRFYMEHGDAIDGDSRSFRLLRGLFRSRFCQRLYAAIHPRWTVPFALRWSRSSRHSDSRANVVADPARLVRFSEEYSAKHPEIDYFIYGHLHIEHRCRLTEGAEMAVLGDWIDKYTYAVFDGKELAMRRWNG